MCPTPPIKTNIMLKDDSCRGAFVLEFLQNDCQTSSKNKPLSHRIKNKGDLHNDDSDGDFH